MRSGPIKKTIDDKTGTKNRTEAITRIVALVIAFVGVFYFFIKLLFL